MYGDSIEREGDLSEFVRKAMKAETPRQKRRLLVEYFPKFDRNGSQPLWDYSDERMQAVFNGVYNTYAKRYGSLFRK